MDRGVINHRDRAKQLRDFSGLRFGNITPTDIDGLIDFGNKYFIILEFKVEGVEMPRGQEIALERLVDNLQQNNKPSMAIIGIHNHPIQEDIDCANCLVEKYRYKYNWKNKEQKTTIKEMIDTFLNFYKYEYQTPTPDNIELTEEDYKKIDEIRI